MSEELKTLKDIQSYEIENFVEELKVEAVKWWKEKYNFGEDVCCTCEEMWRDFFNLTEEDLKDE